MKRTGINIALLLSILLILGAGWFRYNSAKKSEAAIVSGIQPVSTDSYNQLITDYLDASASSTASTTPQKPLTNTDLIGRQLILDYVDLATSGKSNDESINALANKYLDQLPSLTQSATINIADLKTAFNTRTNFQTYGDAFAQIEKDYADELNRAAPDASSLSGPQMSITTENIGKAYTKAASRLKSLVVPVALLPQHIQLINSYTQSAAGLEAASESNTDSTKAFAGIISFNKNIDKEASLVTEIVRILKSNGIQI